MANWEVTKTTKHGKPIEEHTAKIGRDHWKIESMPHISPNFGSLNRWDDLRGLRQISTGNIEMLKRQAEAISTKKDAVSDLLRSFSRPGAKARFALIPLSEMRRIKADYAKYLQYVKRNKDAADYGKPKSFDDFVDDWMRHKPLAGSSIGFDDPMHYSRPGAPDTFAVEDRFYFGKGRKERFADDAKQIADTILKQLGGGRFIAMTGAKNLAFSSSPPGLRMSIGRGAKDAIKYLRVDYDRGSDTYTMIFANKSGGTVKSVSNVYADSLQRVFTSTTGFDTHL